MITMTLAGAAKVLGLHEMMQAVTFQGLSIDTRTVQPGALFVALEGTRVDGHQFLEEAQQKGASAALVAKKMPCGLPQLQAPDVCTALGQLGAAWRARFNVPVVAVTGSNGKTTLKNMIAAILIAHCQDKSRVLATPGTCNNHLGLPLALAQFGDQHRFAVLEMGMNHFGEIAYLSKLARPTVAIITNAAASHLAGVGNVEGVAQAKGEIFLGLHEHGVAVLNRDDPFFSFWKKQIGGRRCFSFGIHPEATVRMVGQGPGPCGAMELSSPKGDIEIQLPLLGQHNKWNALAATAAALALDVGLDCIKKGLEESGQVPGRMAMCALANGATIIDDTYNANPFSLQAAVNTLKEFKEKKVMVLGDMNELGQDAAALHRAAGDLVRQAGIHHFFTYGPLSKHAQHAFGEGGCHFDEQPQLVDALRPFYHEGAIILVKGSRSMHMENIVNALVSADKQNEEKDR